MNRRDFLLSAPAASLVVACPKVFAAAPTSIRLIDSGGTTGESIAAAYIPPFTEKYGVRVVREAPSSLGKLCATTAIDGGPGSCTGGVCCNAGGNTICTLPSPDVASAGGNSEAFLTTSTNSSCPATDCAASAAHK